MGKPGVRPFVLWTVAVALGVAAGISARGRLLTSDLPSKEMAQTNGFDSPLDLARANELVNATKIDSINTDDFNLLLKYADRCPACVYVTAVIQKIRDDDLASKCLPICAKLSGTLEDNPILMEVPEIWKENGCINAARELLKLGPWSKGPVQQ